MDPIHQFQIKNYISFGKIGGADFALTNSAVFMLVALAIIVILMIGATARRAAVRAV